MLFLLVLQTQNFLGATLEKFGVQQSSLFFV
jgi:hypothetical protein